METAVVVVEDEHCPVQLALDDTHIYWTSWNGNDVGSGALRRAPRDGGDPETLATTGHAFLNVAATGDWVYWIDDSNTGFLRVRKDGGRAEEVSAYFPQGGAQMVGTPDGLFTVADGRLWFLADDTRTAVERANVEIVEAIALGSDHVYWASHGRDGMRIARQRVSGGATEVLLDGLAAQIEALAVDERHAWFVVWPEQALWRVSVRGGGLESWSATDPISQATLAYRAPRLYRLSAGVASSPRLVSHDTSDPDGSATIVATDARFPRLGELVADARGVFVAACSEAITPGAILSVVRR